MPSDPSHLTPSTDSCCLPSQLVWPVKRRTSAALPSAIRARPARVRPVAPALVLSVRPVSHRKLTVSRLVNPVCPANLRALMGREPVLPALPVPTKAVEVGRPACRVWRERTAKASNKCRASLVRYCFLPCVSSMLLLSAKSHRVLFLLMQTGRYIDVQEATSCRGCELVCSFGAC